MANNIHKRIFSEQAQDPSTRTSYIEEVEKFFDGRTLVTFFTSFDKYASIDHNDCDMMQSVLQHMDLSNGLVLMINSPGGDGLAAERIVNTCRAYSGTGDYWAIVPGRAKSAATIVCMGASKIIMAAPSELGPVDPQIIRKEGGIYRQFSAHGLVSTYDKLFDQAVKTDGNLDPFVVQLQKFDIRDVNTWRDLMILSADIAVKLLKSGMMNGLTADEIKEKIALFLDPSQGTISHGRSINRDEAEACGLTIERLDVNSPQWQAIYNLYARTDVFVSDLAAKTIESRDECFYVRSQE